MWLNSDLISQAALRAYRKILLHSSPNHIVIDGLFNPIKLCHVTDILQSPYCWQTQRHTYNALYVDQAQWQQASNEQRFVQRDIWQRPPAKTNSVMSKHLHSNIAHEFLVYLRSEEFMALLSRIFKVAITDLNVASPEINTNYFRLGPNDLVAEHADDSPGRQVCMLLYLNKEWDKNVGGELVFSGKNNKPTMIAPLHNRCVLFDPSSEGAEHWVNKLNTGCMNTYRYNVTSWYWSI